MTILSATIFCVVLEILVELQLLRQRSAHTRCRLDDKPAASALAIIRRFVWNTTHPFCLSHSRRKYAHFAPTPTLITLSAIWSTDCWTILPQLGQCWNTYSGIQKSQIIIYFKSLFLQSRRGCVRRRLFSPMEIAGESPSMPQSTSRSCPSDQNCLAYDEEDSPYICACPSAKSYRGAVSDLPLRANPVNTTCKFITGESAHQYFLRLCPLLRLLSLCSYPFALTYLYNIIYIV